MPRSVQSAIEAMPETGTVAPMRAMPLELPGVKSGSEQGIAIGVDPAGQPNVDGTEFQGITQSSAYAGLKQGGVLLGRAYARKAGPSAATRSRSSAPAGLRRAEVVGIIDAIGAMAGMEMRLSLDTMKRIYDDYQPAELAVEARAKSGNFQQVRGKLRKLRVCRFCAVAYRRILATTPQKATRLARRGAMAYVGTMETAQDEAGPLPPGYDDEYEDAGRPWRDWIIGFGSLAVLAGVFVIAAVGPPFVSDKSLWINRDNHGWIVLGVAWGLVSGAMIEHVHQVRKGKLEGHHYWWEYIAMPLWWGVPAAFILGYAVMLIIGGVEALLR